MNVTIWCAIGRHKTRKKKKSPRGHHSLRPNRTREFEQLPNEEDNVLQLSAFDCRLDKNSGNSCHVRLQNFYQSVDLSKMCVSLFCSANISVNFLQCIAIMETILQENAQKDPALFHSWLPRIFLRDKVSGTKSQGHGLRDKVIESYNDCI